MKILYYDCFSGVSGDMNLGALVDVGVPFDYICKELEKLNLSKEFKIIANKDVKKGIAGTKVKVFDLNNHNHNHNQLENHEHHHNHKHDNIDKHNHIHIHNEEYSHSQDDQNGHVKEHKHHHHNRTYKDILEIIKNSTLKNKVKFIAISIFEEIAISEGKIHNKTKEEVHFHEVGAIDSIIDVIGAAIAIEYLNVDKIISSPVEVGYGMINCAHGIMPVPAPATAEILKNVPIKSENVNFEATTPTGAAILKALVSEFTYKKNFKIEKIGYGIGEKENQSMANVLRVFIAEDNKEQNNEEFILECNIDDMRAEEYELLMERLFKENALDVFFNNIFMKKQRIAIKLSVICKDIDRANLKKIIFLNSSTIGIREYKIDRTKLIRTFEKIKLPLGEVNLKLSLYDGKVIRVKPEYDDCRKIAIENNLSIDEIYKTAIIEYELNKTKDK